MLKYLKIAVLILIPVLLVNSLVIVVATIKTNDLAAKLADLKPGTPYVPTPVSPIAEPAAPSRSKSTVDLSLLSTTTSVLLTEWLPVSLDTLRDVRELRSGVVVAIIERAVEDQEDTKTRDQMKYASVWVFDVNRRISHRLSLDLNTDYGNSLSLSGWNDGAKVEIFTSPGEAFIDIETFYIDANGNVLVNASVGAFQEAGNMRIKTKEKEFIVDFDRQGSCRNSTMEEYYDPSVSSSVPTTTLRGLTINKRAFPFPSVVTAECEIGYGESINDPTLPNPEFDGENITFHVTGYDVVMSLNGNISYTPKTSYYIPCEFGGSVTQNGVILAILRLIREDETGVHVLHKDVMTSPALASLEKGQTCFTANGVSEGKAHFNVIS